MKGGKIISAVAAILGLACLLIGLFVIIDPALKSISGLLTGIGAAAFPLGLGNLIWLIAAPQAKRLEQQRKKDIEVNDERNIRIREKAGAAANRVVSYMLCAAILTFGMLGDIYAVLITAGVMALQFVLMVVFTGHYARQI